MTNWFPKMYDMAMLPLERTKFKRIRSSLLAKASGKVLEIGSGSGVNFPYYMDVIRVDAIEPNPDMNELSRRRKANSPVTIHTHVAGAENLPFAENTFDSVVATLVFCTIPDPKKAIQEIQRVAKPGAKILLFEHVKMNQKTFGKMQDVLTPFWKKICDGCHLNRDTLEMLKQAGVSIQTVEYYFKGLFLTIECSNQ